MLLEITIAVHVTQSIPPGVTAKQKINNYYYYLQDASGPVSFFPSAMMACWAGPGSAVPDDRPHKLNKTKDI